MKQQSNPVCWFEIYVEDMERAKNFYGEVLSLSFEDAPPMEGMPGMEMAFFPYFDNAANASGALVKMADMKPAIGAHVGSIIYFQCEDCAVEAARVVAAGGAVQQAKTPIGEHGFCAICNDTEGNTFGLHSMR